MGKNQIVCISSACWYPFPTRKQNVMSRLPDSEILYFDPPVTLLAPLKDKKTLKKLFAYKKQQPAPQPNITVYSLPPVLPFYNKFRWVNRINQFFIARFIRKKMKKHGFDRPILWCYLPSSCDAADKIPHSGLVYDCVDRHSAYGGHMSPETVDRMERELAQKCDAVFSTAQGLHDTLSQYTDKAALIPNGANYELFSRASAELECPDQMKELPHPIFGFTGMLQSCIDYDCAIKLADSRPDASVVFIGRVLPGVDISALEQRKNIHLLGLKPYQELPEYISQFDVCLNMFKSGKLSKDVSPLKFYEYLATGKPIVSTPEPLQVGEYADVVRIAATPEEFAEQCSQAAERNDAELVRRRMEYGRQCSWDARVAQMTEILEKRGIFNVGGQEE